MKNQSATTQGGEFSAPVPQKISAQVSTATSEGGHAEQVRFGTPSALAVAAYLVQLAASEDEPEFLTHLRLQKLLYYVQGWSLALRNKPAFSGRIEAWSHGPVVVELYSELAKFSNQPIPIQAFDFTEQLTREDQEFVASIWEALKGYSASALRKMTHKEPPWMNARGTSGPADRCNVEITHDELRSFFNSQATTE